MKCWAFLDIRRPLVAWEVYRGIIISSGNINDKRFRPLSLWHTGILKEYLRGGNIKIINEIRTETIRRKVYPQEISRLEGIYLFQDRESAVRAVKEWGGTGSKFNVDYLTEVEILPGARITKADSQWVTFKFGDRDTKDNSWIENYWKGIPYSKDPHWELIVDGRAKILNSDLCARARQIVKNVWPTSEKLLEISRIASELGFNLGHVVPFTQSLPSNVYRVAYIIDMRDANNEKFIENYRKYVLKNNISLLLRDIDFSVPDLRKEFFEFRVEGNAAYPLVSTPDPDLINKMLLK